MKNVTFKEINCFGHFWVKLGHFRFQHLVSLVFNLAAKKYIYFLFIFAKTIQNRLFLVLRL